MAAMKKKKKSPTLKERSVLLGMKPVQRIRSTLAVENAERSAAARQRRRKAPGMGAPIRGQGRFTGVEIPGGTFTFPSKVKR